MKEKRGKERQPTVLRISWKFELKSLMTDFLWGWHKFNMFEFERKMRTNVIWYCCVVAVVYVLVHTLDRPWLDSLFFYLIIRLYLFIFYLLLLAYHHKRCGCLLWLFLLLVYFCNGHTVFGNNIQNKWN